jgi:hypothetical protein
MPSTDAKTAPAEITMEVLYAFLKEHSDRMTVQIEELHHKLETIAMGGGFASKKKAIKRTPKQAVGNSEGKVPANTMYWWKTMFVKDDPSIKKFYTPATIETARKSIEKVINAMPAGNEEAKKGRLAAAIWKTFSKDTKDKLKTMFGDWKTKRAEDSTATVDKELDTDDEKTPSDDADTTVDKAKKIKEAQANAAKVKALEEALAAAKNAEAADM